MSTLPVVAPGGVTDGHLGWNITDVISILKSMRLFGKSRWHWQLKTPYQCATLANSLCVSYICFFNFVSDQCIN